jgi:hypothetical protein
MPAARIRNRCRRESLLPRSSHRRLSGEYKESVMVGWSGAAGAKRRALNPVGRTWTEGGDARPEIESRSFELLVI